MTWFLRNWDQVAVALGQHVTIVLTALAIASVIALPVGIVAATGQSPGRLGNEHPSLAPYEPYPAADGQVVVAVANPRLWTRFCAAMGIEDLEHDPRFANNTDRLANRDALNAIIGRLFESQSVDSLLERLSAAGVPCGRVRTIDQVLRDPQLAARQMLIAVGRPYRLALATLVGLALTALAGVIGADRSGLAGVAALAVSLVALVISVAPYATGTDFGSRVKAYLVQNPEVMQEVSSALVQKAHVLGVGARR